MEPSSQQRSFRPLILTAVLFVVLVVAGFGAWRLMGNTGGGATPEARQAITNAKCDYDDKDLCKFIASWKVTKSYTVEAKQTTGGEASTTTMQFADSGKRSYVKGTGGGVTYEIITINDVSYTKAGDAWWKRTITDADAATAASSELRADIPDPTQTEYKKQATEACGDLKCFKYQIVDAGITGVVQYIWFDTKDYQLRKLSIDAPGSTSEQTFNYEPVTISEPSPVKDLAPNQMIVPGSSAPVTVPDNLGL